MNERSARRGLHDCHVRRRGNDDRRRLGIGLVHPATPRSRSLPPAPSASYNALNRSAVLELNNAFDAWQTPSQILVARFFKFSAQFDF
jgi:hypothetical protein